MQQAGDYDGRKSHCYEAVLHEFHHSGQNDQVSVEGGEDGSVYITTLRERTNRTSESDTFHH